MVKRVLITGGLGYVGGRIVQHLVDTEQFEVVLTSRNPLPAIFPKAQMLNFDPSIEDYSVYLENIDAIVHLAAMNEIDCVQLPYQAIDVNITQSLRWLNAAKTSGVKTFIYFSTVHVYGSPLDGLIDETKLPRPTHPYSITHRATEDYVLAARAQSDLNGIVVRLSNSFGAPILPDVNRWTLLVNDLCRQVMETGRLTLHSDGSQQRDFITLTDVVSAVAHLLALDKSQTKDGLFNLAGETTLTVYEMTEKIAERHQQLFGSYPPINRPAPAGAHLKTLFCSAQKLKDIGFVFQNPIDREIDQMLRFCHQNFSPKHD